MSLEEIRTIGSLKDKSINGVTFPDGEYELGSVVKKSFQNNDDETITYGTLEVLAGPVTGEIPVGRVLGTMLKNDGLPSESSKRTFYFPSEPVNTLFSGDMVTVVHGLQGRKVTLKQVQTKQQSGYPEKGTTWATAEIALDQGKIVNKTMYRITKVHPLKPATT